MFGSVVAVAFQSGFYLEMHQNNFFIFLIFFLISVYQINLKTKKILISSKEKNKKISKFFKNAFETQKQTAFYEIQLKKHVKTALKKLCFKLNFLVDPIL